MINEQLKEFGLTDKEIKTYLSLLELGPASVQDISKLSGLNRSTSYVILKSLMKSKIINMENESGKRMYYPISPEYLIQKTENLISKYSKIERDIESIIPNLHNLSKKLKNQPKVVFFEGIEGIKSALDNILSLKTDSVMRTFSKPFPFENNQSKYDDYLKNKRMKQKIKLLAICPYSKETKNRLTNKNIELNLNQYLFLPPEKYSFTSDLSIYDNKIILISPHDEYGVIIENDNIAETMKELFDLAWEEAKRIGKKY